MPSPKTIIALSLLLFSIQLDSLGQKTDSLEWIKHQKDDTVKVNSLLRFSRSLRQQDYTKAVALAFAAKSLAKKIKFAGGIFKSNDELSIIYNNNVQFVESLSVIKEMLDLSDSINNNALLIRAKFRQARTYHFMGSDFKSIKIYHEIAELLPKPGGDELSARCDWEIADSYTYLNDYKLAQAHFEKALDFYTKAEDHDAVMRIDISLGELTEQQNNHKGAITYFKKALTVLESHQEIPYQTHFFSYIRLVWARSSFNDNQTKTALDLYTKALNNDTLIHGSVSAACMAGLGEVYLKTKNYSKAINYLRKAIDYFEEKKYYKLVLVRAYSKLIEAYESSHSFAMADATWGRLSVVKDSVQARQQKKELSELNIRYEVLQNEQQIAEYKKEKKFTTVIIILLSGLVLISIFFVLLFISRYRLNFLNERRELEMIAMRSQMNPHFIFNCLNSINDFIIRSETERSSNYLAKFAKLIRHILNNSRATFVVFENELNALRLYLELEAMRFDEKFSYHILVSPEIDSTKIEIPSMIIQPYVENSIWHGIQHLNRKGRVLLSFNLDNQYLVCSIEDDGVGRSISQDWTTSKQSTEIVEVHGTLIAKERLNQMVKSGNARTSVNVIDLKNEDGHNRGTRVELTLPFRSTRTIGQSIRKSRQVSRI